MSIISKMRRQVCTYWPFTGNDDFGNPTFGPVVQISCRWEDTQDVFLDKEGREQLSNAIVYVDRACLPGGYLCNSPLALLTSTTNPKANLNAWEIRKYKEIPNLKATESLRSCVL